ncbi:YhcH/YjgK/YiaL family protein [Shewanella sp. Choline-02u-19]|uniref:YhcH/YjgK/YiaL family protein n=1 Tax=unclassified Shewanella TaxID=196818 RepID=UPI000C34A64E|nr:MULTISPECIES: YhcH/YjgK/YiaL family protein [unclassified Shewanella]PKG74415.1 YhcH/YjgK/YiaL family protein [Shewanella sp. GutCb]PKH57759.1 YhcH/YjgK/YiaL family protein [Shewanella sp. Bg11-22]PKI29822.1 YhcH/YjgK/YiaL family protein [Shewanella sp. Choline-02u-19]
MIVDTLANRALYSHISPRIAKALAHLSETNFSLLEVGTYELEGKDLFVIVNDYQTKSREVEPFEVHQQYIDVQYVVSGEEEFGYLPLADQTPSKPYFAKHDYAEFDYLSNKEAAAFIPFKAGMFALFFPEDMHMPGTSATPKQVRKVVIKVKI